MVVIFVLSDFLTHLHHETSDENLETRALSGMSNEQKADLIQLFYQSTCFNRFLTTFNRFPRGIIYRKTYPKIWKKFKFPLISC